MSLIARPMDPGSETELQAVLALFNLTFGRPLSAEFYRWRFLQNPFGPPLVSLLWDGDTLAGHYGASAMRGWMGGPYLSSQSMTTMTHPDYRNRDVFTTLASDLYARMSHAGIRMIWGYPNTKSHFGLVQRLGWLDVALLPTMTRELADVSSPSEPVVASEVLPPGMDELFLRSDDGRAFLSARDERYLKWRYADHPDAKYTFFSLPGSEEEVLAVGKTYQVSPGVRSLEIVDFLYARRPGGLAALLGALLPWAKERGFGMLRAWAALSDPVYPYLEKLRFAPREPLTYFCVRPLASPELPEPSKWSVTMGDSDNY